MSLYGKFAHEYAAHAADSIYNARYERPAMQGLLGDVRQRDVLDAGCAAGEYVTYLLQCGARVVGIDRSETMLDITRARAGKRARLVQADLSKPLSVLENASFDVVLSSLTMHYIEDWSTPLAEFARVLRSGGRFLMSTHHPAMTLPQVDDYFTVTRVADAWRIGGKERTVTFYHRPLQAIVNSIVNAGFRIQTLVEPRLQDDVREVPAHAEHLRSRPWFLIIDAVREP